MEPSFNTCAVTIKMESGELLTAGKCTSAATASEFKFNNSTNLFVGLGGLPANGWMNVGADSV